MNGVGGQSLGGPKGCLGSLVTPGGAVPVSPNSVQALTRLRNANVSPFVEDEIFHSQLQIVQYVCLFVCLFNSRVCCQ